MSRLRALRRRPFLAPLLVLLTLSALELHSRDETNCVDPDTFLKGGEVTAVSIQAPTWLGMLSESDHVYRIEGTGPDGAGLEVWTTDYDSMVSCNYFADGLLESATINNGRISIEWTGVQDAVLKLIPAGNGTSDFLLTINEVIDPQTQVQIVPTVTHTPGADGTTTSTDLRIFNPSRWPREARLQLQSTTGKVGPVVVVTIEPRQILVVDDVVGSLLGLSVTTGALIIESSAELVAVARTSTEDESGSYGQLIPALPWSGAAGRSDGAAARWILPPTSLVGFRSKVGFVEVSGVATEIDIVMYKGNDLVLGTDSLTLEPFTALQIDSIFAHLGVPPQDGTSIFFKVGRSQGRVLLYASLIDEVSGDSTYLPSLTSPIHTTELLMVPAAVSGPGSLSSYWRTDLRAMSYFDGVTSLEVTFLPGDGSPPVTGSFAIERSFILSIDDVVGQLGASGSGALILRGHHNDGSYGLIMASSRTYNTTERGVYGQFIPALASAHIVHGTILRVDGTDGFRTNIGLFNPHASEGVDVLLRLVSGEGAPLGCDNLHLSPLQHLQLNNIFSFLEVPPQSNCRVDLETLSFHPIFGYASVINDRSGDPMFVPAIHVWNADLGPATIELSNLDNAFLLDDLPEAVGTNRLPEGSFTAEVSGSGNLGRSDLPIRVLCLYKSPAGELRSAAMPIGGSLVDIGGGQRFWCVIPDWISRRDNTGTVTVSLTSAEETIELILDARDNAVLLDQLPESVVVAPPESETYRVEMSGDLGRPELSPQAVLMYRDVKSGRLQVRTPAHAEIIDHIDTTHQLLVVMVDWINRNDNTGTTTVTPTCSERF